MFDWEKEIRDHYAAREKQRAGPEAVLRRMGGFAPDVGLEGMIIGRDRDPAGFEELNDRNPGAGLGMELSIYEISRDAAIATGAFDPAAYRRENGLEPGTPPAPPATTPTNEETPDAAG